LLFRRTRVAPRKKGRRRIRKLRLLALLSVLGLLALGSFCFGMLTAVAGELPSLEPERLQKYERDGYIYASNGKTVLTVLRGSESRVLVKTGEIAPIMRQAIVAIEDKRFWEHPGVDLRGIARAALADLREQELIQGGSTITQQFVKNAAGEREQSIGRKVREAALAWQLTQRWSKAKILTAYLNTIYFGNGAYGVQQAAETYFHHGAKRLTLPEAALLAGIPADPSRWDPVTNPIGAKLRRRVVLRQMREQGLITRAQYRSAALSPLPSRERVRLPGIEGPAQYFVNYVKQQLVDEYGSATVFGGGLRVVSSIDLKLQQFGREAISKWLTRPESPSAALVAMDPRTGRMLVMVGGNNYRKSQFNLAVQGQRQPGSSFKPFVLAAALEEGLAPSTQFVSRPLTISLGDRVWSVENYEKTYLGSIDLEAATIHSDNAVYAELTQLVTPARIVQVARRLGIRSDLEPYFSIGLGAQAVNPLEMARAFSAFAREGLRIDGSLFGNRPRAVLSVQQGSGGKIRKNRVVPRPVLSRRTAGVVNDLLQRVVEEGTGKRAALPDGRPVAGKTGTTENYGDGWFVGYTPQLVAAVWVGDPERLRPMLTDFRGEPVAGGTYPALIWKSFMERALAYMKAEPRDFASAPYLPSEPRTVVVRNGKLSLDNGYCRQTRDVWLQSDRPEPARANCKPNEVEVPRLVGSTLAEAETRLAAQPLRSNLVLQPAAPRQRVGIVLRQRPAGGSLSSYDEVTLFVTKATHGVVPRVVGLPLRIARARLERLDLEPRVVGFTDGKAGRVLSQVPRSGLAAAPGLEIELVVARG